MQNNFLESIITRKNQKLAKSPSTTTLDVKDRNSGAQGTGVAQEQGGGSYDALKKERITRMTNINENFRDLIRKKNSEIDAKYEKEIKKCLIMDKNPGMHSAIVKMIDKLKQMKEAELAKSKKQLDDDNRKQLDELVKWFQEEKIKLKLGSMASSESVAHLLVPLDIIQETHQQSPVKITKIPSRVPIKFSPPTRNIPVSSKARNINKTVIV